MKFNNRKSTILFTFLVAIFLFSCSASSTDCWNYDESDTDCNLHSDECTWMEDPWGSWCDTKGCWNFWNQDTCNNSTETIGKACMWMDYNTSSSGWCEQKGCWSFDGTNAQMVAEINPTPDPGNGDTFLFELGDPEVC